MDDDERSAVLGKLAESVRQAQAASLVNRHVLREVVRDLADAARNRHGYLADMFERISARADRWPLDPQSNPALIGGLLREELAKFFAEAATVPSSPDGD